ncbi:MAG: thiamine ABC transporter substrate-binding protein, partial [Microbacteriaceae bacterium]
VPGASTSSPGLAFLLATIAEFGEDGWQKYWAELVANDVTVTSGWSDAYYVDFTAGGGEGDRPIVLSYGSSPAFAPGTSSLDDTCYRQVEYAGVISGTKHEAEAQKLVDFLLSSTVQGDIAENMWVFPVNQQVALPAEWLGAVSIPEQALELDPLLVEKNREKWILEWSQIATP